MCGICFGPLMHIVVEVTYIFYVVAVYIARSQWVAARETNK